MVKLHIDGLEVKVADGATVLDAARKLGVDIPTMCFLDGCEPFASCMICVVKDVATGTLIPACSALAEDGMEIICDDADVRLARKQSLELLLSDHIGDCAAPCEVVCPAHIRIPRMIRQIRENDGGASSTALNNTAESSDPCEGCDTRCEKVCRRRKHDDAVAIRSLVASALKGTSGPIDNRQSTINNRFNCTIGRLVDGELGEFMKDADDTPRTVPVSGILSPDEAQRESRRCLHCDCRKADSCKLREFSTDYSAQQRHFRPTARNPFRQIRQHADVVYEPEKCIKCGLCVQITERESESLGLTFIGRGFDVRIGTPFGESLDAALTAAAEACVAACPTAALAWKKD